MRMIVTALNELAWAYWFEIQKVSSEIKSTKIFEICALKVLGYLRHLKSLVTVNIFSEQLIFSITKAEDCNLQTYQFTIRDSTTTAQIDTYQQVLEV